MSLHADYQKLEPGDEIRLFEIDGSAFNMGDILYFHGYNIPHTEAEIVAAGGDESKLPAKSIWWQGIEYKAWPCELEGIESSTSGSDAQPTLRVGNIDGSISALCLHYDDLALARVVIHDTQKQYLDAKNFPDGNASADPTQEKRRLFFIDVKHYEDDEKVEFTLSSPFALQGMMISLASCMRFAAGVFAISTAVVTGAIMPAPGILTGTISQLMTRRRMSAPARSRPANYVMVRIVNCRLAGSLAPH